MNDYVYGFETLGPPRAGEIIFEVVLVKDSKCIYKNKFKKMVTDYYDSQFFCISKTYTDMNF